LFLFVSFCFFLFLFVSFCFFLFLFVSLSVLDASGSVLDDVYSGIQTITASVQDNTGCEHADSQVHSSGALVVDAESISAGTTCTVSSGVCTFSGQILSTWANALVREHLALHSLLGLVLMYGFIFSFPVLV
jgi:hypothetical protein